MDASKFPELEKWVYRQYLETSDGGRFRISNAQLQVR